MMTEFEKELRRMLTEKENDLLDRALEGRKHRDGCIADMMASYLRRIAADGTMDLLY